MPKICSKCNSQTNDTANFCQQCGHPFTEEKFTGEPLNPAQIVAIQEMIKDARRNEIIGWVLCVIGTVILIILGLIYFSSHTPLGLTGFAVMIVGVTVLTCGVLIIDSSKTRKEKLINELRKGK